MSADYTVENFKEIIEKELKKYYNDYSDRYDHEYCEDLEAYGDTYVGSGSYITENSEEQCFDDFKEDFDVDEFFSEYLNENIDFRELIKEMALSGKF